MFYSPQNQWAYEPVFVSDITVNSAVFELPQREQYGIVITRKDGTSYCIEDEDG